LLKPYAEGCNTALQKNRSTYFREAQKEFKKDRTLQEVDPIVVIETVMRYYFALGQKGLELDMPVADVRACFKEALAAAAIVAP
jgi:hypothetical protein